MEERIKSDEIKDPDQNIASQEINTCFNKNCEDEFGIFPQSFETFMMPESKDNFKINKDFS